MKYHLFFFLILIIGCQPTKWQSLNVPKKETVHKITFYENQFWGVNYGDGKILKSNNKGKNWFYVADLESEYFEKIQFLDANIGFVCGDYGYVYKTNDGGISWKEISPEIEGRIIEQYRNDTTKNQKPDGLFVAYYDMYFKNNNHGYVSGFMNNPNTGFRESYQRLFYETKDGGITWERLEPEDAKKAKTNIFKGIEKIQIKLDNVYYLTPEKAWTIARKRDSNLAVKRTKDGGATWEEFEIPDPDVGRWMAREVLFVNEKKGFLFGGTLGEERQFAIVYFSEDGGETWKRHENDWPHVHHAIMKDGKIWLSGKGGLILKQKKAEK